MHKILPFGALSIKMNQKKSSVTQFKKNKKSLVSFLNNEVVLSKRVTVFPWLIIASFINNVPIATHVLHQTPRHRSVSPQISFRKKDRYMWQ